MQCPKALRKRAHPLTQRLAWEVSSDARPCKRLRRKVHPEELQASCSRKGKEMSWNPVRANTPQTHPGKFHVPDYMRRHDSCFFGPATPQTHPNTPRTHPNTPKTHPRQTQTHPRHTQTRFRHTQTATNTPKRAPDTHTLTLELTPEGHNP